ncbi:MAG TPA: MarR family transcriptional regulator [Bacteroidia bacterium]|nr:MarR family transcriptional regulator [Bacteroidia bacterium]
MNLINEIGSLALAARMQKLGDAIRKEATQIYKEQGIDFESKWFPVVYLLSRKSPLSIVELANELGYAHPSIIALIKELQSKKLVRSVSHKNDKRKRLLSLTPKAIDMVKKMEPLWEKMLRVNNSIINNKNNLLAAIEEAEEQIAQESFYSRMQKLLKKK